MYRFNLFWGELVRSEDVCDRTYELLYQSPVSGATAGSIAMRLDALFRSRLFKCVLSLEVQGTQYPMMASLDT
ncbi:MAG: hypothetical protein KAT18_00290, partial [Candidatus Latescibacteria bacterium]|nr:hypothetical protein [Candidatus Latescibacterota bacterium]